MISFISSVFSFEVGVNISGFIVLNIITVILVTMCYFLEL